MVTTSLKLSDQLKQRTATVAERLGISSHAFMVSAIELAATAAEQRVAFVEEALTARQNLLKQGKGFEADEVHAYLRQRIAGEKVAKPKAKSWRG